MDFVSDQQQRCVVLQIVFTEFGVSYVGKDHVLLRNTINSLWCLGKNLILSPPPILDKTGTGPENSIQMT